MEFFKIKKALRLIKKILHKRSRFAQLLKDIDANQTKFDKADRDGKRDVMDTAWKRDEVLRDFKTEMSPKPKKFGI